MSLPRIYQPIDLSVGATLSLDQRAHHYLTHVLRVRHHAHIVLFNGKNGAYEAIIDHIDKKKLTVTILNFQEDNQESNIQIHLGQGIARSEKMDLIIQKATELGVTEITPLITDRTQMTGSLEKRLQHWQTIAMSACEQCGRNRLPEIHAPVPLSQWLIQLPVGLRFIFSPVATPENSLGNHTDVEQFTLCIGPEGGLTTAEIEVAGNSGFIATSLGPRILRTETAAIAALSILQYLYGDL